MKNQDGGDVFDKRDFADRKGFARGSAGPSKTIAEHKVVDTDTLSAIALTYYKHATRPYWMVIYEANKAVIGNDPGILKPGITLKIPELPQNLKD